MRMRNFCFICANETRRLFVFNWKGNKSENGELVVAKDYGVIPQFLLCLKCIKSIKRLKRADLETSAVAPSIMEFDLPEDWQ